MATRIHRGLGAGRGLPTGRAGSGARRPSEGGAVEQPDLGKLGEALRDRVEIRSIAITGLFVLAVLYTLYFARAFLLPIVLAVLLDFLLSPLIRALKRARDPRAARRRAGHPRRCSARSASAPTAWPSRRASGWPRRPQSLRQVQSRLRELRKPVEQVTKTAEQVEAATEVTQGGAAGGGGAGPAAQRAAVRHRRSRSSPARSRRSSCSTSCSRRATCSCRS